MLKMPRLNLYIATGKLVKEPDIKEKIALLRIAIPPAEQENYTSEKSSDQRQNGNGSPGNGTGHRGQQNNSYYSFMDVKVFANRCRNYDQLASLRKGDFILVCGQIRMETWQDRSRHVLYATSIQFFWDDQAAQQQDDSEHKQKSSQPAAGTQTEMQKKCVFKSNSAGGGSRKPAPQLDWQDDENDGIGIGEDQ